MTAPDRPLAVFDIDGVVADVSGRLRHLQRRSPRWDLFFDEAADDPALPQGLAAVELVRGSHDVVWMSGRPRWLASVTRTWLLAQGLPVGGLHLRPDHDRSPATRLKLGLLATIGAVREVAVVVDDDVLVVDALRSAGWPVQHADWAPRERRSTLRRAQQGEGRT